MSKKEQEIQPIDASLDDVAMNIVSTRRDKPIQNNDLQCEEPYLPAGSQLELFQVETQIEFEDIELGVLENGTPYLSESGLARMIGIDRKTIYELSSDWLNQRQKPRGKSIDSLLRQVGYIDSDLYVKAQFKGQNINAYTEPVCMALLEYYAFEASEQKEQASRAYRRLAREGLRHFVYSATGYKPEQKALDSWKHFHDRTDLTMDAAPFGYFGVFREIAIMIVPMIRAGIMISDRVVPDISVGKAWSSYWEENKLSEQFGERMRYDHEYPDYYPQSKSNPQPSFCYPNGSLGVFREWLQQHYIATKFPKYLLGQTSKGSIAYDVANKAVQAFGGKALPAAKSKRINK